MQLNIEERVKRVTGETIGVEEDDVHNAHHFIHDLDMDSLDAVELLMAIEDEFGIEISDEDAENIDTAQQEIDYVTAKV